MGGTGREYVSYSTDTTQPDDLRTVALFQFPQNAWQVATE